MIWDKKQHLVNAALWAIGGTAIVRAVGANQYIPRWAEFFGLALLYSYGTDFVSPMIPSYKASG